MTTNTNDNSRCVVMDSGTGEIRTGKDAVPLFMRDDGDKLIDMRKKELEIFLKCLETYPAMSVILREKTLMTHDGGEDMNEWFLNRDTKKELLNFLILEKNHKVNGKIWSNGILGSRWADTTLNGINCRIAFYTRKSDPNMFGCFTPEEQSKGKDYAIILSPNYFL